MTRPPDINADRRKWHRFTKRRSNHARTLKIVNVCGLVFAALYLGLVYWGFQP